jgi:FSR family fosmidomycin resistance protein-like MFS transporter
MSQLSGIAAAVPGIVADATSITYIFKLCAWLPLPGMLAVWLPDIRRSGAHWQPSFLKAWLLS